MPKAASRTVKPTDPPPQTNTEESEHDARRRLAGLLAESQQKIQRMIESQDDWTEEISDLQGILMREYRYHMLRAEELKRDLFNAGINV